MARTYTLTIVVEDDNFINHSVEAAAKELVEMVSESLEPADMLVDEVVTVEENKFYHAELQRTE